MHKIDDDILHRIMNNHAIALYSGIQQPFHSNAGEHARTAKNRCRRRNSKNIAVNHIALVHFVFS